MFGANVTTKVVVNHNYVAKPNGLGSYTHIVSQNYGHQNNDISTFDGILHTPISNQLQNFSPGEERGHGRGYGNNRPQC